ncbi:MAG: translocation/assembly module TamB, partial [Sphingomonas sp.]|nr:translocation/assembly module TamB [Sphingomonas sp.]
MDEIAMRDDAPPEPPRYRLKRNWAKRLGHELLALLLALALLLGIGLVLLDTAPGHRFIVDRIGQVETATGLKFRIGRIEGSIFGKSRLKNVAVMDPSGVFFTSPEIELDWSPAAWLSNKLSIDSVHADRATLIRLPKLKPTGRTGPMLPSFDIRIGKLSIDRLEIGLGVTGTARVGRLSGSADIRSGRALVELNAIVDGADRLALKLDAEPDGDRFDIEARASSPADGVLPAIVGVKRSIDLAVSGDGSWTRWRGNGALNLAGRPAGRLALTAENGRYGVSGAIAPSQFLTGKLKRLTAPVVRVRGSGTLEDRILDGRVALGSAALRAVASGAVDLATSRYRKVRVGVDVLQPRALFPNMRGRNVRMTWTLNGPFDTASYAYRLTSPSIAFDNTGFIDVRAEGKGRLAAWPMRVPLHLKARAITGVGDTASDILRNASLDGMLTVTPKLVRGEGLQLRSDKLAGKVSLLIDLVTGRFEVLLSGGLKRYLIEGLGIVDVLTELRVVPGPAGRGSLVTGSAKAWVRRLDNSFFADLTGGLPRIETGLTRTPDGILRLHDLQMFSPSLRLSGEGRRNRDGTFHIVARGRQAKYGPLRMTLDGNIARPRVDLLLDRPNDSMGLKDVRLLLNPTTAGFDYRAAGGSRLGAFTSNGGILMPRGGRTTIAIAALDVGGTTARGNLRSDPGGFTGTLALAGGGVEGTLGFAPVGGAQKIEAHLAASSARFPGALAVRRGRLDGTILVAEGRTTLNGVLDARGLELSGVSLARITANANLVNG